MKLVEQHTIRKGHPSYDVLDQEAYRSKNLYNATLYAVRQRYTTDQTYLPYARLNKTFQEEHQPDYYTLPTKVAQQTMRMVDQAFKGFFKALKSYKAAPNKFKKPPRIPKYLDKDGRYLLTYTSQAISKRILDNEKRIKLSGINVSVPTLVTYDQLLQVRVVRKVSSYIIEVVFDDGREYEMKKDNGRYAAVDLGVNNMATVTSNIKGFEPFAIDGRRLKSINRHYNKTVAECKSILTTRNKRKWSLRTRKLAEKRDRRVKDYLHKASRMLVNQLVSNEINTIIIGHNHDWKQDINIGRVNNQNFVQIPFGIFISMLKYKCEREGITLREVDEAYTSKCSFLDCEEICRHDEYAGRRIKRGLFRSGTGRMINADVNGSYNILRKSMPKAFADGVAGVLVHPRVIKILN